MSLVQTSHIFRFEVRSIKVLYVMQFGVKSFSTTKSKANIALSILASLDDTLINIIQIIVFGSKPLLFNESAKRYSISHLKEK